MKFLDHLPRTVTTFFYVGYLPFVPGTFGSLIGVMLFYLVSKSIAWHLGLLFSLTVAGFILSTIAERSFHKKDPRYIVIDEVSGMLLALLFIPCDLKLVIIAFALFRLLDTIKPYPASTLQKIKGGAGIMLDDLVAGIYTNLILQAVLRLATFRGS